MRITQDFVAVRVPATSANLGPGFDSFGLALDLWDEVSVHATAGATHVTIEGEGAGVLDEGENHLVVQALRMGLDAAGVAQVGIQMRCMNRIPHSRGLGSSASAIVAGLGLARALIGDPEALTAEDILSIATEMEGHPDNVAPAISGGVTISWMDGELPGMLRLLGEAPIEPVAFIPDFELATSKARAVLPQQVPFDDAKFNLSRAGILAAVLSGQNHVIGAGTNVHELLMAATEDRLHQDYRRQSMQPSHALVTWLRGAGKAAVISGAGPTVLSLESIDPKVQADAQAAGWAVRPLKLATSGLQITRGNLSKINGGCLFV